MIPRCHLGLERDACNEMDESTVTYCWADIFVVSRSTERHARNAPGSADVMDPIWKMEQHGRRDMRGNEEGSRCTMEVVCDKERPSFVGSASASEASVSASGRNLTLVMYVLLSG